MHTRTSVRRLRRSVGLGQKELAGLLGVAQSAVSRLEAGAAPESEHLFALQVLFDETPDKLFEGRFERVAEAVAQRAAELERGLMQQASRRAALKRSWLRAMINRIVVQPA